MDEVRGHLSTINRILESHDLHLPHIKKHGSGSGTGEESFVPNQDQSTSGSGVLRNNELEFLHFDISSTGTRSWRRTCYGWVLTIQLAMLNVRTYSSTKRRPNHAGHTSQKGCATFSLRTNSHRSSSLVLVIP
uniref:Uncharacterized protein n=1 Tax=Oryza glumipatula TaxID=40148 RepID=A0A0D9ZJ04_9ORYZ